MNKREVLACNANKNHEQRGFFSHDELLSGKSGGECRMKKDEVAAADLRSRCK